MTKDIQKLPATKNWLSTEVNKLHRLQLLFWINVVQKRKINLDLKISTDEFMSLPNFFFQERESANTESGNKTTTASV